MSLTRRNPEIVLSLLLLLVTSLLLAGCGGDSEDEERNSSNALEFLGRIDQEGPNLTGYGYVTHVDGVKDTLLLGSQPIRASEKTARLTFRFKIKTDSRAQLKGQGDPGIFVLHTSGTIEFFNNEKPAGDFADPDSFAQGEKVGSGTLDSQNIITVRYTPKKGISDNNGRLSLEDVSEFEIDGEKLSLGKKGDLRFTLAGGGTSLDAALPRAEIDFAGVAVRE
ncbi:MAG: hypothetical protein LC777_18870 [Actinobacteria bacterium]|nr:hypothetical protein [Actinomycetota bacterium]